MTRQEAIDKGQEILARMEADAVEMARILGGFNAPFDDEKCDAAFARLKRRWWRFQGDLDDWHSDATECIKAGDVTIKFGGGK